MATAKKPNKPEPIAEHVICSQCGMNWEKHGESPTLEDCVRLLKIELARPRLSSYITSSGIPANITTSVIARGIPLN